jgi:hypothetical protein
MALTTYSVSLSVNSTTGLDLRTPPYAANSGIFCNSSAYFCAAAEAAAAASAPVFAESLGPVLGALSVGVAEVSFLG